MNYLYNKKHENDHRIVKVGSLSFGGKDKIVIGGPCSVEDEESLLKLAHEIKNANGHALRGGAYKPRTSPYEFQGLKEEGIKALNHARKETGLPIVSELMGIEQLDEFVREVDIIQIGARNMQNFELLKAVGKTNKPILLKRGIACTIDEWLMSAEYILAQGNPNVILCERGIRTFERATRNTLDLSAVCVLKERTHLPVLVDPSHGTGNSAYVEKMALAAIMAGADGIIVEVHAQPMCALSDGPQCITPQQFKVLCDKIKQLQHFMESEGI